MDSGGGGARVLEERARLQAESDFTSRVVLAGREGRGDERKAVG